MNEAVYQDTASLHAGTDTLRISVHATEKIINYDSIFRSQSPDLPRATRTGSGKPRYPEPRIARTVSSGKSPEPQQNREDVRPAAVTRRTSSGTLPDYTDLPEDAAAKGIMSAGLTLILAGVVLELFLQRKGRTLYALGLAALLAGLILL